MAYQAKLEKDMTAKSYTTVWEEICVITHHVLHLHKVAVQAAGRAMGLVIIQEPTLWLGLTNLLTKKKRGALRHPCRPSRTLRRGCYIIAEEM